jgi:hypothetical protein
MSETGAKSSSHTETLPIICGGGGGGYFYINSHPHAPKREENEPRER